MTSTINASTTAGIVTTADTSGVLALQTAGTTAVTVDASQNVTLAGSLGVTKRATFSAPASFDAIAASKGTVEAHTSYGNALAGNGSSYDLMLLNRNGQEAFGVVANTQNVVAAGTLKGTSTISVGAATPSTSGAGITFPATQSASSDANTLDDYEEGTWTPSIGGNATYTNQDGQYTRIGRLVVITGYLQINVKGTGSINVITGMPFNQLGNLAVVSVGYYSGAGTAYSSVYGYMNSNTISFTATVAGGSQSTSDPANLFANSTNVYFSCSYFVAT